MNERQVLADLFDQHVDRGGLDEGAEDHRGIIDPMMRGRRVGLYLDRETLAKMRALAFVRRVPHSRVVADAIAHEVSLLNVDEKKRYAAALVAAPDGDDDA